MWKLTQINPSRSIIYRRFDSICAIAKVMRGCHCYYLSAEDRRLYGCNETYFTIHAIDIPDDVPIPASLLFRLSTFADYYDTLSIYKDYVLYLDQPWMMLPLSTQADHLSYQLVYLNDSLGWAVLDKDGYKIDYLNLYGVDTDSAIPINTIRDMVFNKRMIEPFLGEKQFFGDMEKSELIQDVMATKASEGARYMSLTNMMGKRYGFMMFKNLFNLNKSDQLTIVIRDRLDIPELYEATFITTKKKSPIPEVTANFCEQVYAMFINI